MKANRLSAPNLGKAITILLAIDRSSSVLVTRADDGIITHAYPPYAGGAEHTRRYSLLGFNGQLLDSLTRHYLLGNGRRLFNTRLMRFNSPDALSPFDRGGNHSYAYCAGDPVNRHDPTGGIFEYLTQMGQQFKTSFLRHTVLDATPGKVMATPEAHRIVHAQPKSLFGERVAGAYIAKDSNGASPLPPPLQRAYVKNVVDANAGEISSTTAHLNMAAEWSTFSDSTTAVEANIPPAASTTAIVGHLIGAATAGGADISNLKTGKIFRLPDRVERLRGSTSSKQG